MLEVLVLIVISVAAIRAAITLHKSKPLFVEFQCPQVVTPLVLLFPLGPLLLLLTSRLVGLLPAAILALACFIPGLVALQRARYVFDRTGTDRTKVVQDALAVVFITGFGGVAYVVATTTIAIALTYIRAA